MVSNYRLKRGSMVLLFFFYFSVLYAQTFSIMEVTVGSDTLLFERHGVIIRTERYISINFDDGNYIERRTQFQTIRDGCIFGRLSAMKMYFLHCNLFFAIFNGREHMLFIFDEEKEI